MMNTAVEVQGMGFLGWMGKLVTATVTAENIKLGKDLGPLFSSFFQGPIIARIDYCSCCLIPSKASLCLNLSIRFL